MTLRVKVKRYRLWRRSSQTRPPPQLFQVAVLGSATQLQVSFTPNQTAESELFYHLLQLVSKHIIVLALAAILLSVGDGNAARREFIYLFIYLFDFQLRTCKNGTL